MSFSIALLLGAAGAAWGLYVVGLTLYRLFLHPLAGFPGPKYAALSRWHEFYYDVYLGGKFIFYIEELHKKYGLSRLGPCRCRESFAPAVPLTDGCCRPDRTDHP